MIKVHLGISNRHLLPLLLLFAAGAITDAPGREFGCGWWSATFGCLSLVAVGVAPFYIVLVCVNLFAGTWATFAKACSPRTICRASCQDSSPSLPTSFRLPGCPHIRGRSDLSDDYVVACCEGTRRCVQSPVVGRVLVVFVDGISMVAHTFERSHLGKAALLLDGDDTSFPSEKGKGDITGFAKMGKA